MARRNRVLPARKPRDRSRDDDSLLLRSAESLGRVIGALQRQLDGATRRLSSANGTAVTAAPRPPRKRKAAKSAGAVSRKRKSTKKR
jgi:hypothetical protein